MEGESEESTGEEAAAATSAASAAAAAAAAEDHTLVQFIVTGERMMLKFRAQFHKGLLQDHLS